MTSSNDPLPLTFYPAYCFSQSPTFHTWVKLTAADVHALKAREGFEGQKIYFHLNHPIKWIRLVGVVVALDEYEKRWIATVDDGSGATVEIACAKAVGKLAGEESVNGNGAGDGDGNAIGKGDGETTTITITSTGQAIDLRAIEVGSVIKAKGGIGEFRGVRQMLLERIALIKSTNEEIQAWNDMTRFRTGVLSQPWIVAPEMQQALLEEANGTKRRKGERERRRKEKDRNKARITKEKGVGMIGEKEGKGGAKEKEKEKGRDRQRHKRRESDKENGNRNQ
ncbi:hypothetical protein MMC16_006807 [Acarospora aff. strigata]|nr:hypothetical protein [Acarospora aff. strigata]